MSFTRKFPAQLCREFVQIQSLLKKYSDSITKEDFMIIASATNVCAVNLTTVHTMEFVEVNPFKMGATPITNAQMNPYISVMGRDTHGTVSINHLGEMRILTRFPLQRGSPRYLANSKPDFHAIIENIRLVPDPNRYEQSAQVFSGLDHPAVFVSWCQAMAFAAWASQVLDVPVRLPTAAEWERAARGPDGNHDYATVDGNLYDKDGQKQAHVEFYRENQKGFGTAPVKNYPANPFGIYDLSGNVWEWMLDLHQANNAVTRPGLTHLIRGGSWLNVGIAARSGYYSQESSIDSHFSIGFRLVKP